MLRSIFILIFQCVISIPSWSQSDTLFFKKDGQSCNRNEASSYKISSPQTEGFLVREFDINGTLKSEYQVSSFIPREIKDGLFTQYLKTGEKVRETFYKNGMRNGNDQTFYPNGKVSNEGEYRNDLAIGAHLWYNPEGKIRRKELYDGGKMLKGTCYSITGADTTYFPAEEMPEFPGKEQALYQFIANNVHYPKECRKKSIEGKVFVKFKVGNDGLVSDCSILRSVHPLLDAEALRVVSSLPKWNPGRQEGKPVTVMYTLPISFKLQ